MIVKEYYSTREDGVKLFRTYSDTNHKIMQKPTMAVYDEAIDIEGAPYEYVETDELIDVAESTDDIMPQD
jgi:hypothetical protein